MAERAWGLEEPPAGHLWPVGTYIVKWTGLLNGDTGAPFVCSHLPDKHFEASGTWGAGGKVAMQAAAEPALAPSVWNTMRDPSQNVIELTSAAAVEQCLDNSYAIRPNVTAGDGTTSLTVRAVLTTQARR